jgi:peptide deformylase
MDGPVPYVLFNPRVVNTDGDELLMEEGCLSFPGLVAKVKRHNRVRVRFQVPSGATVTKEFMGMSARCIQHEMQHLSGVPFITGIGRLKLESSLKKAKKLGYDYTNMGLMKYAISSLQ